MHNPPSSQILELDEDEDTDSEGTELDEDVQVNEIDEGMHAAGAITELEEDMFAAGAVTAEDLEHRSDGGPVNIRIFPIGRSHERTSTSGQVTIPVAGRAKISQRNAVPFSTFPPI